MYKQHLVARRTAGVYGVGVVSLAVYLFVPTEVYHVHQKLVTGSTGEASRVPPRA